MHLLKGMMLSAIVTLIYAMFKLFLEIYDLINENVLSTTSILNFLYTDCTLQGSHSKPSPFCAVGRAVNKHPVLIKKYCGPHVIGCLRSETSKINIKIIMTLKILFLS